MDVHKFLFGVVVLVVWYMPFTN